MSAVDASRAKSKRPNSAPEEPIFLSAAVAVCRERR